MIKITTLIISLVTFLNAQAATEEQLNSIYKEATLFVIVFGVMGVISFVYSRRHAKEYKPKKNRPLTWEAVEVNSYFKRPDNWGSCLTTRKEHLIACNGWDEDPLHWRMGPPDVRTE